jgi:hypothetical protein
MEVVGIVQCPLSTLVAYGGGRQIDNRIVNRLVRRYSRFSLDSTNKDHIVTGIITYDDLDKILLKLGLTKEDLYKTLQQDRYPLLSNFPIAYLRGRHRLAAANYLASESAWAVRLHCVHASWTTFPKALEFEKPQHASRVQDEVEFSSCESAYSDGEIYRLVRKYMAAGDDIRVDEVRSRLTACKEVSLKGLLQRRELVDALDKLLEFPGIIGGLQLGNVHKHLALHIDEHIQRNFEHIHNIWSTITGNDPLTKQCVDLTTVRTLQLRAPIASAIDRSTVKKLFKDGVVFSQIQDGPTRDQLESRILSLQCVIPSIESFHENMKLVSIAVHILRDVVLGTKKRGKNEPSFYRRLSLLWRIPIEPILETRDGVYDRMSGTDFQVCYAQLLLASIRNFPRLSKMSPRQDSRGVLMTAFVDESRVRSLLQLASLLGFDNDRIREGLRDPPQNPSETKNDVEEGRVAQWRCGRPFTGSYLTLQADGFLHNILKVPEKTDVPSSIFILRDILQSFFCDLGSFRVPTSNLYIEESSVIGQSFKSAAVPPVHLQYDGFDMDTNMNDVAPVLSEAPQIISKKTPRGKIRKGRGLAMVPRRGEPTTRIPTSSPGFAIPTSKFNVRTVWRTPGVSKNTMASSNDRRTVYLRDHDINTLSATPLASVIQRPRLPTAVQMSNNEPGPSIAENEDFASTRMEYQFLDNDLTQEAIEEEVLQQPKIFTNLESLEGLIDSAEIAQRPSIPPIRQMKRQRLSEDDHESIQIRRMSKFPNNKKPRLELDLPTGDATWKRRSGARSPLGLSPDETPSTI